MATIEIPSYETLFQEPIAHINERLNLALQKDVHDQSSNPAGLWEAMRYGTLNGGKRIRSVLALESCKACGGQIEAVLPTACAIELVHAQSLMHDDLPCMDNDDLRRGKPSVHKAYGESTAVLAGDALIALAFGLISKETPPHLVSPHTLLSVISDFSDVTSIRGLVNGQYVDILYEGKPYTPEILEYIHTYKTGALFRFSTRAGAQLAGAAPEVVEHYTRLGQHLGLTFQIVDDLLDIDSTPETLGKTVGKDQAQQKATYPALFGVEESRRKAEELANQAHKMLDTIAQLTPNGNHKALQTLVDFISHRIH